MSKILQEERGQAIFEMLIFLPFFAITFVLFLRLVGPINASINQQKAVRGYYYHLLKGSSQFAPLADLTGLSGSVQKTGAYMLGWQDYADGKTPVTSCFKLPYFTKESSSEPCNASSEGRTKSKQVKIFTAYGICSASYQRNGAGVFEPDYFYRGSASCTTQ